MSEAANLEFSEPLPGARRVELAHAPILPSLPECPKLIAFYPSRENAAWDDK